MTFSVHTAMELINGFTWYLLFPSISFSLAMRLLQVTHLPSFRGDSSLQVSSGDSADSDAEQLFKSHSFNVNGVLNAVERGKI